MELLELLQDCCYGTKLAIKRKRGPLQSDGKDLPPAEMVKSLETWCLVTVAPSNHKAVSMTDALWEIQHILFSLRPAQCG